MYVKRSDDKYMYVLMFATKANTCDDIWLMSGECVLGRATMYG